MICKFQIVHTSIEIYPKRLYISKLLLALNVSIQKEKICTTKKVNLGINSWNQKKQFNFNSVDSMQSSLCLCKKEL